MERRLIYNSDTEGRDYQRGGLNREGVHSVSTAIIIQRH